jgi:hypothetical protein
MKTVVVNNYARSISQDRFAGRTGECGFSKHFDLLTYPNRLQPLRGMETHTTGTSIGNIILGSDGLMYGLGLDGSSHGQIYKLAGYGATDAWAALSSGTSNVNVNYNLLVEYKDATNARTMFFGGPTGADAIIATDPSNAIGSHSEALTYTNLGQGFVHPKDKRLYIPYDNKIAYFSSASQAINAAALTLPSQYRIYCLTNYGDYLAIPQTVTTSTGLNSSIVSFWNRDTSVSTVDENITWGAGSLQVLNNLNGVLIGVSNLGGTSYTGSIQDFDAVQIKVYEGGAEPRVVKEIRAQHLTGASHPTCTINPRVNFIYNNRLYFSINVDPGDSLQAAWYGLWSVGKNQYGEWTVVMERVATNANSETGVLAAAITGDFVAMVHSSVGTLVRTINGQTSSNTYAATSVYESLVNPDMPEIDKTLPKNLYCVAVNFLPLPSGASVTLKYRTDSSGASADWITVASTTTAGDTRLEATQANGETFAPGTNFEFRIESTGGAVIMPFAYRYEPTKTNLL